MKSLPTSCKLWMAPGFPSELALRALATVARDEESLIFVMDWLPRRFVYIQGSPQMLFGVALEDLIGDPSAWQQSLSAYEQGTLMGLREELAEHRMAVRMVNPTGGDGVVRSLRCDARLVEVEAKTFLCGSVFPLNKYGTDIQAPNIMREAVEHAREGLAVTDPMGNFVYLNKEHAKIFGYEGVEDMIGKSWKILYLPDDIKYIEDTVFPELGVSRNWCGQLRAKKKDGTLIYEFLSLSLLPGGGIVCNCRDVSEEIIVARRLQHSEELFRVFLNALPIGVMIRKVNGDFEFLNHAIKKWFAESGIPQIEVEALSRCMVDDPVFGGASLTDKQVGTTGESVIFDYPFSCGDRSWVLEVEKHALYLDQTVRSHVCTLVRDVTNQRRLEEQSEITLRRSEEYNAMQREFIAMVSHEFRTPLTSIQGLHYLLGKKSALLSPQLRNDYERLLSLQGQALANLKRLVDQVLMINRLEHGTTGEPLKSVRLAEFITELIDGLNLSLAAGLIRLEMGVPIDYTAEFDPDKIRVAIENLISNAIKYSPIGAEVRVSVGLAGQGWLISVADHGRGIPKEDQAKIFQPFHRASNVGVVSGTGLGLAIVRRVVDFHDGTMIFSSTEGLGTDFTLTFPIDRRHGGERRFEKKSDIL